MGFEAGPRLVLLIGCTEVGCVPLGCCSEAFERVGDVSVAEGGHL